MKILHVITSLRTGGAEKLMVDLLPRLKDEGHDVDLLLFDGTDTPFRQAVEAEGIHVYDLGIGGSVYSPKRLIKLIPFLKKYDVVHTHNTAPQLFAAIGSLVCKVCMVTTEHSTSNRRRQFRWYALVDRWMYNRYRKVICISSKVKQLLIEYIGHISASVDTIYNGIDVKKYSSAEIVHLKEEDCKIILLQVAGFRYQKDQDTVIKSLLFLPDDIHLYLVGDGERRNTLKALVEELNLASRVHFLSVRNDVPNLLKSADIVVMSSHIEGFGLAAIEGMAAGKPVVATDIDGLREVVNGAGVLFPHSDSKALSNIIRHLISDSRLYTSVAASCHARASQFDISNMVKGYSELYNNLMQ